MLIPVPFFLVRDNEVMGYEGVPGYEGFQHQSASEHRRNKRIDKICLQNLQTFITPSPTLADVGEVAGQIPFPLRKGFP